MVFIELNSLVVPSLCCDIQVQYYISVLLGKTQLKTSEEMLRESEDQIKLKRGFKVRHVHALGYHQWTYYKEVAEQGKFEQLNPKFQLLYDEVNRELEMLLYIDNWTIMLLIVIILVWKSG